MNGYTFSFVTLILATLAGLIYLANEGHLGAIVTLAVLLTILLIALGAGITWLSIAQMAKQQERQFRDNVSENIGIMKEMQTLQNKQNATLMQQLGTVARLPAPQERVDLSKSLMIEEGIFSELED